MTTLFELTADIQELERTLAKAEEVRPEAAKNGKGGVCDWDTYTEMCVAEWFLYDETEEHGLAKTELEERLADKIDAYVHVVRDKEATIKARKKEMDHLRQMNKAEANAVTRLKEAVKYASQQLGRPKLKGNTRTITVSENSRPAIEITDESAVPDEYKEEVVSWRVDKKAIADHVVETGEILPGVEVRKVISVMFR